MKNHLKECAEVHGRPVGKIDGNAFEGHVKPFVDSVDNSMKQTSSPQGKVRKLPRHARSWLAHERGSGCSGGGTKERPTTAQGRDVEVGDGGVGT